MSINTNHGGGPYCDAVYEQARIPESQDHSGWQPIETPPKNGTRVLVMSNGKQFCVEYQDGDWITGVVETNGQRTPLRIELVLSEEPTHWMPLPAPPKEAV